MGGPTPNLGKCPVMHGALTSTGTTVTKWWPSALNLDILHQHGARTNPMDPDYNHREAVKSLDHEAVLHSGSSGWSIRPSQSLSRPSLH